MNRQFLILVGLVFISLISMAQTIEPPQPSEDEVNALAKQLYCPVCENVPLDVCPTQACAQWRDLIRQKLASGWTEQQIKDYFMQQYGDRVMAEPPKRGLNWLAYILPPLFLVGGAIILYFNIRSMHKKSRQISLIPSQPASDPYFRQIEEELQRRRI